MGKVIFGEGKVRAYLLELENERISFGKFVESLNEIANEEIGKYKASCDSLPIPKKIECTSKSDDDDWEPGDNFTLKENGNAYWNNELGGFTVDYFKGMRHRFKSLDENEGIDKDVMGEYAIDFFTWANENLVVLSSNSFHFHDDPDFVFDAIKAHQLFLKNKC